MKYTNKKELRQHFIQVLRNQKEADRVSKSLAIQKQLFALPEFRSCRKVLFYASFGVEVDTYPMMQQAINEHQSIYLPIVDVDTKKMTPIAVEDVNTLNTGPYGIKAPVYDQHKEIQAQDLDAVIVPGLAFDRNGNRLGRGAGYYDRFLTRLSSDALTIGLAYDCQTVDHLPLVQDHDIRVSRILTN